MEKPRVLSGEALVAKGITKIDASLPEVGLKDVTPNGSWLEQKQIQAALEARKYLIEVERIEKCGTLSHAEWQDNLMLAEVTQKAGGHWQYLGHNVGKKLFLRPEEALFLMEVNCLLLKHNEVTVSLQKAYSLLLSSPTAMIQYKVYASLSRLGYRVFRHTGPKVDDEKKNYSQKVASNANPPTTRKNDEFKYSGSATADMKTSKCIDSNTSTVNNTQQVDSPTVSTVESKTDSSVVSTLNNSENVGSPIEATAKESENEDSSVVNTAVEPEKAESGATMDTTVSDSKSDSTPIVETVPDSDIVDTTKIDTAEKSANHDSPMTDKMSENEQEQTIEQEEGKGSEINGNILETCDVKASEEITEKLDAENSVAKENESPNIMEVDDTADIKDVMDDNQEVSSTMIDISKNAEITTESMEICTEDHEAVKAVGSGDADDPFSATNNSEAKENVNGSQTIEDSTKCLKYNNDPSTSSICPSTENTAEKVYFTEDHNPYSCLSKIEKLTNRQLKPSDSKAMDKYFENIPDLSKEQVATINVPEQQFIPKNIFVNKETYILNLQNIKMRTVRSVSSESPAYSSSDEASGRNIRRIRSSVEVLSTEYPQNQNFNPHGRFLNFPRYHNFRPYGFWRPQSNLNFYQLMFFQARVQFHQRPNMFLRPPCFNIPPNNFNLSNNDRKRMRNGKSTHLQSIKDLAVRFKQSLISGNTDMSSLGALHSLLHSYNLIYKARLRLTKHFDVINEEKIVETIDLDDDEESKSKKPRLDNDDDDKFNENLYRLRQLALRLRDLQTKDKATASHRRAFSKAIKTFNKSYNADIYLDNVNYEVIDRRCITLDSSSESDCVVEEQPQVRSKKLRNPFNILKRRKEQMQSLNNPGTSKDNNSSDPNPNDAGPSNSDEDSNKYSSFILKTFNEAWLPNEKDFGRAEVVPKRLMKSRLEFSNKEQFLYEYKNNQFQNWLETKISFLRYLEETNIAFKREQARMLADVDMCNTGLKPLIDFKDSLDMPSALEKLRIIENNKEIDIETSLRIDFDVYNRNVQNFRKRNPPKPHFRIICLDESSGVPSAAHVMSLHSKYDDNVPIVFAIVSIGSISFLQINPIDLPIYVPSNDV